MKEAGEKRPLRPPVVAIVGHIDHGKSTLLDYIRRSNVVEGEAGGITQHLSAYEAVHQNASGEHRITFLDTPGHEAFKGMRARGLEVADVAVLVVSAEDGVKVQTLEALKLIEEVKIPFIVAITKIDKPSANVAKAKNSLLENNVFLEGMGGTVPSVAVSGKSGEGVNELLDLILLAAELEGLESVTDVPAEGVVIEGHTESRRGTSATLIVKKGILKSGSFVVAGGAYAPTRIMENFLGKAIKEAYPGSPVRIVGFTELPEVGLTWKIVETKKQAEEEVAKVKAAEAPKNIVEEKRAEDAEEEVEIVVLPLVIKTDVAGMGEAVMHELQKFPTGERMEVKIVAQGTGNISQDDVRMVGSGKVPGLIAGFNVKVDREARDLAERLGVEIGVFEIIYKLAEWLGTEIEKRRPRERQEQVVVSAKVLKVFSSSKKGTVLGGRVEVGELNMSARVRVTRSEQTVGSGKITGLQVLKAPVKKVETGSEFGALVEADVEIQSGDKLEVIDVQFK